MSRRSRREAPDRPAPAAGSDRLGLAVAVTLALLVAARAALAGAHTMWAWSLELQRFTDPFWGWALWGLAALALVPPVAARALPALDGVGEMLERRPARSATLAALAGAALAWLNPDRVRFVGDFLLRQGTVEVAEKPSVPFPQALPLDVVLHYHLPRYLSDSALVTANQAARIVGALEAGALAWLALALARELGARGAARVAVAASVFFGGYLGMFTGFSKAFAELCLLVAAVALFGLRAMRDGRLLGLGLAISLGIALHRSALGLLPAAAFAYGGWFRVHGRAGAWRRRVNLIALAIPVATLAIMIPRIIAVIGRWDALHFAPQSARAQGGILASAFAGARPADLANLMVMLSPIAPLVPVLVAFGAGSIGGRAAGPSGAAAGSEGRRGELLLLSLLMLPFLLVMPFIHPAQGLFRDWDDFAATGVAMSVFAAWWVARALEATRARWIAIAIVAAALAPTVQWLIHNADVDRGFARVRAFMLEPPPRSPEERGTTWDFLGIRNTSFERWEAAAEAFGHAAETSPSPRILQEWSLAEQMCGRYAHAEQLLQRMLVGYPQSTLGWLGLASVSLQAGDLAEASRAAHELLRLDPGNFQAGQVLEEVARRTAGNAARGAPGDTARRPAE